jgi:hypothetical protein
VPVLVDGAVSQGLKEFFSKYSKKIVNLDLLTPEAIAKYFTNQDLVFEVNGGALYHQRRKLADGQVLFLINSSLNEAVRGTLKISGKEAIEMNTLTGALSSYSNQPEGNMTGINISIPPAGSLLLFFPNVKTEGFSKPASTVTFTPIAATSPMTITRDADNALMVDFCDLLLGNETSKDLHVFNAADKVYKYHGFKNGNPWNTSVQYKTNIVDRDTFGVKTGFTASYHFTIKGKFDYSSIKAVVERPHLWSVELNGKEIRPEAGKWWLDRNFSIFNIGILVKDGENTITLKTSPMKIHAEVEPVYILGNFSVEPVKKGFVIKAPLPKLSTGSWLAQGLPFYSWGVTYSREYTVSKPEGKYEVALGKWKGTIAEVSVNGQPAGLIGFPPYHSDITGLVKQGVNKIDIRIIGSLKNLLGPHHNNPAPGIASPWMWRNIKNYPAGKDYQMFDYGLMEEFVLLNGK